MGRGSEQSLQRGSELGSGPDSSTCWFRGCGRGLSLCPPLKRATILPHRMILRLNKRKSVSEALGTVPDTLSVPIHVASQNSFDSSPSYVQVGSAAGVCSSKELEGSAETPLNCTLAWISLPSMPSSSVLVGNQGARQACLVLAPSCVMLFNWDGSFRQQRRKQKASLYLLL